MYKTFALVAAVSLFPLSEKISAVNFWGINDIYTPAPLFPYKNSITTNPFEPAKKPAEAWSQNWLATAQENIRKSEYNFTWEEKLKAYCTPNRKNNLRFFYRDEGFSVEPRTTNIHLGDFDAMARPDEIKYRNIPNWKVNFHLDKKQVGKGLWKVSENRAEYITDKITIQYINNDEGMRQNFIVQKPLSKKNELKINFSIKTKLKTVLKDNCIQFLHKKNTVLNYQDLKVWDAAGKTLSASFQQNKNKYFINVDAKNAVYPITVDPLSTTPSAILESNQAGAAMGFSVASAGDVNGDGYSDVITGVPGYDNPEVNEGAAFIYHGSATGISTAVAAIVESNQANANLGTSVSGAGDVNGDGYADIIVGANLYDNGSTDEGVALVYHGSATGINTVPATMVESNQALSQLGFSVAGAGDVNADGYSDVIVGAWLYSNGESAEGRAFIYHGSAAGINGTAVTTVESNQVNANLGISVAGAGDVDGDGFSDVIAGAQLFDNGTTDEGAAFIYHGSAAGIVSNAVTMVESNQGFSQFGFAVATAGDVNGDGYSDVIVGASSYDNVETDEGAAFIYLGGPAGIFSTATAMVESNQPGARLGTSVACAGDINGDGYSDIIAGAVLYDNVENNEGAAFIYFGLATGLNTTPAILESNQANAQMGCAVASAGDVNGDGYSDVIVGVYQYENVENNEGGAFVYHGSAAGSSTTANNTPDDADQGNADFGFSVSSAGDVNADGYSDVIIGAFLYDDGANIEEGKAFVYHGSAAGLSLSPNSTPDDADQAYAEFGFSVASAGDVNADGYSDVIIGAPLYNDGVNTDEGNAFVYYGSASGLSPTPNSIPDDANQFNAQFAYAVAAAGDVNGDGYSDVIIGAWLYNDGANSDEGMAFVYYGSAGGLSASPGNILDDADQVNAQFGTSVACAGDVNGDGYSDVLIGAPLYDDAASTNEGRAFVYYGSSTGLPAFPNNTPDDADQANAKFGTSVASAGDVNGDGFSDVIIGAYAYDDGANTNEGRAFVYYGSSTGLPAFPNNTPDDADQAQAFFGISVASAGDVNGDGYNDVIIGAETYDDGPNTDEGGAFVYYGSATGLSSSPGSRPDDANQAFAFFGYSVACAGDINGDGYSDLIIGAYGYDDGPFNGEGRAFIYNGNGVTANKRNNLRRYNTDLITPLNNSNFIFSNFGAGLYAKSFLGRTKGKLVWETRLNYNPYSGTPITNSTFFTAQQAAYTNMGLTGVELKNIINKIAGASRFTKIRARIKYDPVTSITGQVYSPWRNVYSIIDGNNLGSLPIEFISFNAAWQQKGKTARLDFKTDKESGICCFDIEKSADGFNFYSIGTLPARNISGIQSYSFIDGNAKGKNQYYRIKVKGITGQVDYSNIQHLENNKATEILVFPNPTTDVLQLQLNKAYDKMNVQIVNSAGQVVKQLTLAASNQTITIPVQNLPAGKYWLHLQSSEEKQVLQFVKQ
jgi:hypothetical protein